MVGAVLTDADESPVALCTGPRGTDDQPFDTALDEFAGVNGLRTWVWQVAQGTMPTLSFPSRQIAAVERVS